MAKKIWGIRKPRQAGEGGGGDGDPLPSVESMQSLGLSLVMNATFGTNTPGATIANDSQMTAIFDTLLTDGDGNPTLNTLNDEWQWFGHVAGKTHVFYDDHMSLRACTDASSDGIGATRFSEAIALAQGTSQTVNSDHPDGHYWGRPFNSSRNSWDTGVRSGALVPKERYLGGIFEVCCKMPNKRGVSPVFWTLDGSGTFQFAWPPEFDIFENTNNGLGDRVEYVQVHLHPNSGRWGEVSTTVDLTTDLGFGRYDTGIDLSEDYHTYTYLWEHEDDGDDHMEMWLDQTCIWAGQFPWKNASAVSGAAAIQLDLCYGGDWLGRGGCMAEDGLPVEMPVKWFRIWQQA